MCMNILSARLRTISVLHLLAGTNSISSIFVSKIYFPIRHRMSVVKRKVRDAIQIDASGLCADGLQLRRLLGRLPS